MKSLTNSKVGHGSVVEGGIYRKLMSNLGLLFSGSVVVSLLSIVTLSLTAKGLGPERFGSLVLIQAFVGLLSKFVSFESWQAVLRLGAGPRESHLDEIAAIALSGVALDVVASLVAGSLAFFIIVYAPLVIPISESGRLALYIYSFSLLFSLGSTPKGIFRLFDRFDLLVKYQVAQSLVILLCVTLLYIQNGELWWYALALTLIYILYNLSLLLHMLLFLMKKVDRTEIRSLLPSYILIKEFVRIALGTSALASLVGTRKNVEIFVVGHLCGEAGAGVFTAFSRLTSIVSRFLELLKQVIFPEITRAINSGQDGHLSKWLARGLFGLFVIAMVAMVVAGFVGDIVIASVFGAGFQGNTAVLLLLLYAALIQLVSVPLNPLIQASSGIRHLLIAAIASYAGFLILAYPLSIRYGIDGVALATSFGETIGVIMMGWIAARWFRSSRQTK